MTKAAATQTVLVVDADVIARSVIADYLRQCGYRVAEANSAEEAIEALSRAGLAIDTVLSDVELPGPMSGFDLSLWMRRNAAGTHVILAGAVERAARAAGDLCEEGPALAKPYHPQLVVDRIRRLKGR